jgi:hypothetical protein
MIISDFLAMVTSVGYSDYDGYIGDIYFGTYMDRKRKGQLPEQQGTVFNDYNNSGTDFHYRTAATTSSAAAPCTKQDGMPEDMRREYSRLPSTYNNNIGNLVAHSVEAAMNRLRQQQRLRIAAVDKKLASMSQLEKELAIINWEV